MNYLISVLRRERGSQDSVWQNFTYESQSSNDTVATALNSLNARETLSDADGHPARRIEWECSCLQKKCGACAMVINGRPRLACDALLSDSKDGTITVQPLRKFPVICDLMVDRSILFENLKTLKLWLAADAELDDCDRAIAYQASECLQCGCCLEVCPNFYAGGSFFGMAAVPITMRLLSELPVSEAKEISRLYIRHTFEGCGKSLSCRNVCPRGIDTEQLLVNTNALALWKHKKRRSI